LSVTQHNRPQTSVQLRHQDELLAGIDTILDGIG